MVNFIINDALPTETSDDSNEQKRFLATASIEVRQLWIPATEKYSWFLILGTPDEPEYYEFENKPTLFDTWKGWAYPMSLRRIKEGGYVVETDTGIRYCKGIYRIDTMQMNEYLFMHGELQNESKTISEN